MSLYGEIVKNRENAKNKIMKLEFFKKNSYSPTLYFFHFSSVHFMYFLKILFLKMLLNRVGCYIEIMTVNHVLPF